MKWCYLLMVSALLIAGCVDNKFHRAEIAENAKTSMIGMQRKDILSCAGVPVRQATDGSMEFLTYIGGGDSTGAVTGIANSPIGIAATSSKHRYCEVTFVLDNGVVQKIDYAGCTGGWASEGEQCAYAVQNCATH